MSPIYTSTIPAPPLPRTSVFSYLFPPSRQYSYFPAPPPNPHGQRKAFICGLTGRALTRDEFEEQCLLLAGGLKKLGMKKGDVACLFGVNSIEWVLACFGCQAAGVVASPANYSYTPSEILHQLRDSTSSTIFVSPSLLPIIQEAISLDPAYTIPQSRIILLSTISDRPAELKDFQTVEDLVNSGKGVDGRGKWEDGDEEGTAYLCYSSGTTGRAKGVETTHFNMTSQIQAVTLSFEPMKENDVMLGMLPNSHIYGLTMTIHLALATNNPVVVLPRFEEISMYKAIEKYKITFSLIVPPLIITLLNSPNASKYNLTSLRGLLSAAAPLSSDLIERFESKFPHLRIAQGYGLTETSPLATLMPLSEGAKHRGSVGRLVSTFEARLVDGEGKDVKKGERGELWLKGPSAMKGYWRNPDATSGTFHEEGGRWFKTGDVATVDDDGYFHIVDRIKELIKYKGFQVPPAELEALLLTHPEIADVGVIGIYAESEATELPRAYVVPTAGLATLTPTQQAAFSKKIQEWAAGKVANHKKLRGGVHLIDVVPKSPSGKILRKNLRATAVKQEEDGVVARRVAKL
ncbi:hypothetical protein IAT38_007179 [Cryptococcus sp. DSM 104549]